MPHLRCGIPEVSKTPPQTLTSVVGETLKPEGCHAEGALGLSLRVGGCGPHTGTDAISGCLAGRLAQIYIWDRPLGGYQLQVLQSGFDQVRHRAPPHQAPYSQLPSI